MNNPEKSKQILLSEIEKMNHHREDFCKRPGIDFSRDRKIPFDTLLHFQISMERLICDIYQGKEPGPNMEYVFLKSFMDSELDCDKMDYYSVMHYIVE